MLDSGGIRESEDEDRIEGERVALHHQENRESFFSERVTLKLKAE